MAAKTKATKKAAPATKGTTKKTTAKTTPKKEKIAKAKEPKELKYDYPDGLSSADKRKYRAIARKRLKNGDATDSKSIMAEMAAPKAPAVKKKAEKSNDAPAKTVKKTAKKAPVKKKPAVADED